MGDNSPTDVFWLTRDEDDQGVLSDIVDVWISQPQRQPLPGGVGCLWLGRDLTGLETRFAQWSLDVARSNSNSGTLPETSYESIRVG